MSHDLGHGQLGLQRVDLRRDRGDGVEQRGGTGGRGRQQEADRDGGTGGAGGRLEHAGLRPGGGGQHPAAAGERAEHHDSGRRAGACGVPVELQAFEPTAARIPKFPATRSVLSW